MPRALAATVAVVAPLAATGALLALAGSGAERADLVAGGSVALLSLTASISCGLTARRSLKDARVAWVMLACSAAVAFAGETAEVIELAWSGSARTFPSPADAGFLGAVPFAIAGLLAFPRVDARPGERLRIALDIVMVGLSLLFISTALSLPQAFLDQRSAVSVITSVLYPIADLAVLITIFVALRRSLALEGGRLSLVALGLATNAFADSAGQFVGAGSSLSWLALLLSAGSMYGYAMIALAPLFPEHRSATTDELPLWPDLMPYFGAAAAAITTVLLWLTGHSIGFFAAVPGSGLLAVLVANQVRSHRDARRVLLESHTSAERLRSHEQMLKNVIDHAPQGVAVIETDLRITNANPRLASMLYAPLQALVGSRIDAFLPADYVALVFGSLEASRGEGTDVYESDCQARRADGSAFWTHWSCTPIRARDGSIEYFMVTFEDVTAKREAEETAVANLAQLEKLNRLKSEFVSMVSHEFRTALVGIQGFSELIKDQDMEAREVKQLATDIYNDAMRLSRMITEMLDFDRLEAGKVRLDLRPVDINELAREAVERAQVMSEIHVISLELQRELPDALGDADRLTQVMTNLLSNAIKYSPDGGDIRVATRLAGGAVEVSIKDHGRGIPPEFIKRLFGKYERYEDKHAGKIIGTGLGLAITRQIVEMHGGRITVASQVGQGSEFRFTVPLAPAGVASAASV